jgi:hypothetical protein
VHAPVKKSVGQSVDSALMHLRRLSKSRPSRSSASGETRT